MKQAKAPNPYQAAAAQSTANAEGAVASSIIGNANENGPLGTVRYTSTPSGSVVGGVSIPKYTRTITLTPAQKKLQTQQEKLGAQTNAIAGKQLSRVSGALSKPITTAGLTAAPVVRSTDFEPYRAKTEAALMERMNPQLERDRAALESRITNQGFQRGTEAFNEAMNEANRQANDARTQVFLASGNEARAAAGEERAQGGYASSMRERGLQERAFLHNQPINEVSALMGQGQVTMPQFSAYNPASVQPVDIGNMIYKSADMKAAGDAANMNAISGVLGKAVGAGIYKWSDRRLKTDILYTHTDADGIDWYVFRYVWGGPAAFGVMAQEVAEIKPWAVAADENGILAVDYLRL